MIERSSPFSLSRRLLIATSALAIAALVVTAEFNPALSADSPHNGGDITFLIDSLGDTWIPNNSAISSFQGHIWGHLTDKLLYVDADGKVSPWIAERWEQNDKATEFTLHLKSGVTFSDGTALDASAVVANLDIWYAGRKSEGINPIGLFPKTYDHAEAVDATTVKVFFKAPTLGFIPTLGYHGSILISPKALAQPAAQQADLSKTSGSGPYVVDSWKEGDFVKLVKRKDYNWGPAAVGHTGPAYLDTITYPVITVIALTIGELLGGSLITETVFGRTGLGSLVQRSVSTQDLPVLQAVVSLAAVVFVVVNLIAAEARINVDGSTSAISVATGRLVRIDRPRSPRPRRRAAARGGDRLWHAVSSKTLWPRLAAGLPVIVPVGAQLRDRPGADPPLRFPARRLPRDRARQLLGDPFRSHRARHPDLRANRRSAHRQPRS